jgi:hypothetical protein
MGIMANHATSRVSTIKRPNDKQTETGKETLKELLRVHFPDSELTNDSYDKGQGQQNLGTCTRLTNRGDWNTARSVINHSNIKWALGIFKILSLREQMELYLYFCSKGRSM